MDKLTDKILMKWINNYPKHQEELASIMGFHEAPKNFTINFRIKENYDNKGLL